MKKKLLCIAGILAVLAVIATLVGPGVILNAVRQPEPEEDFAYAESFRTDYEDIRLHLQELSDGLGAEFASHPIDESDGLYIDSFYLPSRDTQTNLVVLTTGVHGIEGYIGAAMLDVFFGEIYPTLDHSDTGVLVVANVNPYGMKHLRRYNENNVDLNRNFILDWDTFDRASNQEYPKVDTFLGPTGKIGNALWHEAGFYLSLAKTAITEGADTISDALLTGQYEYPQGVYYGGDGDESSTVYLKDVFARCLESRYENIVHIDIHSGYGPRYNMVIFNSVFETMTEAESVAAFGYGNVIAHDSESFYATTGDTTDFFYRLAEQKQADAELFSTCFEFGTIGDAFFDTILSLKYTVDENRNHWYPTDNKTSAEVVRQNYMELFYPTETAWREKTVEDFTAAALGVLNAKLK
jgi:predicted deacylase